VFAARARAGEDGAGYRRALQGRITCRVSTGFCPWSMYFCPIFMKRS